MAVKLANVVPFGRSLDEYQHMFNLSELDLAQSIIGISDGPASFNAEMKQRGQAILSIDPLYIHQAREIEKQFYKVVDNIISQVKQTPQDWVWNYHKSPNQLKTNRINVLNKFIADYEIGKNEKRYVIGELPQLDIKDKQYDLALCSHFLFLYSEHFDYQFHLASLIEMLRVATEVRIFPLLTLALNRSPHLQPLINELETKGYKVTVEQVEYEMQKGGNEMLRITQI